MASGVSRLVRLRARSTIWIGVVSVIAAARSAASAADNSPARAFRIPSAAMTSPAAMRRAISAAVAGSFDAVVVQNWGAWLAGRIADRIGYPGPSSGVVVFSADGAVPADSSPLTSAQAAVSDGSR